MHKIPQIQDFYKLDHYWLCMYTICVIQWTKTIYSTIIHVYVCTCTLFQWPPIHCCLLSWSSAPWRSWSVHHRCSANDPHSAPTSPTCYHNNNYYTWAPGNTKYTILAYNILHMITAYRKLQLNVLSLNKQQQNCMINWACITCAVYSGQLGPNSLHSQ